MGQLPQDPIMLYSVINTKLRDFYSSLEVLCEDMGLSEEELKEKFIEKFNMIPEENLFNGRNLSMELCIESDLKTIGLKDENIYSLKLCTHCEKESKLFSYRASNGTYGRLFSFIYIK